MTYPEEDNNKVLIIKSGLNSLDARIAIHSIEDSIMGHITEVSGEWFYADFETDEMLAEENLLSQIDEKGKEDSLYPRPVNSLLFTRNRLKFCSESAVNALNRLQVNPN